MEYEVDEQGLIKFKNHYEYLYSAFYHSLSLPYSKGPPDDGVCKFINSTVRLTGEGFLFHDESPFIRIGVDTLAEVGIRNNGDAVRLKLYRMSISTGRMVPILDTSHRIVSFELKGGEVVSFNVRGISSTCIHSSDECDITVTVRTQRCVSSKRSPYCSKLFETVPVGYRNLLLDAVCPKYAPIEYLVQNSLSILSVNPPLAGLITVSTGTLKTVSCKMIFDGSDAWADFTGGTCKWCLDIPSTQVVIQKLTVVTNYSSNSKITGTIVLKNKSLPGSYNDCKGVYVNNMTSINGISVPDIANITIENIEIRGYPYDNIAVVLIVNTDDTSNIFSPRCTVVLKS